MHSSVGLGRVHAYGLPKVYVEECQNLLSSSSLFALFSGILFNMLDATIPDACQT
jgi:hypothetical protein